MSVTSISLNYENNILASGGRDCTTKIWDINE